MNIMVLLDTLENLLDDASKIPFSGRVGVDRDELLEIARNIRIQLPDEIKQAQWIKDERQSILDQARKEADSLIKDYENKISDIQGERDRILHEANKEAVSLKIESQEVMEATIHNKDRLMEDARKEAEQKVLEAKAISENMVKEADRRVKGMIEQSEVYRKATEKANEVINLAQQDAKKIRLGSMKYADDVLSELEKHAGKIVDSIQKNKDEMRNFKN